MVSNSREEFIVDRIKNTVELFFENDCKISDNDLAEALSIKGIKTSSSTVGRDLISERAEMIFGVEVIDLIRKYRQINKELGLSKGGKNSVFNNDVERDEYGKFRGSKPRR